MAKSISGSSAWKTGGYDEDVQDQERMERPGRDPLFSLFPCQNVGASNGGVSGLNEGYTRFLYNVSDVKKVCMG